MRRFLLCLLLLPLATVSFAQSPVAVSILASNGNLYGSSGQNFYSYNPNTGQQTILNASGPAYGLDLCLERSDGTLLAIGSEASGTWQAFDVTLAGVITVIASFPSSITYGPGCPAIANDGNYYGSSPYNGDYNYGFIYQLTSAGKINIFYNFTGGPDGRGPSVAPLQASDGNLYWYTSNLLLRYSPATGLTPTTLSYYGGGLLLEASDGNFYVPGGGAVVQITPKGATTIIYTPPEDIDEDYGSVSDLYLTGNVSYPLAALTNYGYHSADYYDGCYASGNYLPMVPLALSGAAGTEYFSIGYNEYSTVEADGDQYSFSGLVFGGNGNLYAAFTDENQTEGTDSYGDCEENVANYGYNQTYAAAGAAPITMSLSQTHVKPGGTAALTWQVNNAYSDTLQQCFGFGGLSGKVALAGSATVSAPAAGSYVSSIVCGGTETGLATLVAGNATLSLNSSAYQVNQGSSVTLTATVTNAGTPAPTGKVNFLLGSTVVGSASLVNNTATLKASTAGVPPGTYHIVASYVGNANYGPATSSAVAITVVGKAPTSTTLTPTTQGVLQGANISLTATVTGNSTHGSPTGSVKFMVGSTLVGAVTLSYQSSTSATATLTASTAPFAPGTYSVTASYGGDGGNLASNSNNETVTVTVNPTTPVTLAISPNPVPTDTSFTLTATVKGKDNPTGTVFFYVSFTEDLASANVGSGGVAKVIVPAGTLASGSYQMTATYAGDANNPSGTSPAVTLTVQ